MPDISIVRNATAVFATLLACLNILERLWKFAKKNTLYAKYIDDAPAFHLAVESFFININKNFKQQLKSLLTLNFQFFDGKNVEFTPSEV